MNNICSTKYAVNAQNQTTCFEELDQFHQDLPRSPSLNRFYSDPCTDLCSCDWNDLYYYYRYLCLYMVDISINL